MKEIYGSHEIIDSENFGHNNPENIISNLEQIVDVRDFHNTPFLLGDVFVTLLDERPELFYGNQEIIVCLEKKLCDKDILYLNRRLIEVILSKIKRERTIVESESIIGESLVGPKNISVRPIPGEISIDVKGQNIFVSAYEIINQNGEETDNFIHDITGDSYFVEESEYTTDQFEFNYFFNQPVREIIENDLGIKYSDYKADELFCFLTFLKKQNQEGFSRLKEFINRNGVDIVRLFSILKDNHDKSEQVLNLEKHFSKADVTDILSKYTQLTEMYDRVEFFVKNGTNYYTQKFEGFNGDQEHYHYVKERELEREAVFLDSRISTRLKKTFLEMIEKPGQVNKGKIAGLKGDILIVTSALDYIKSTNGRVKPDEFKDFDLQRRVNGSEITEKDFADIKRIYQENYVKYPELQKVVIDSFEKSMSESSSLFTILRYQGNITGFYRVDALKDDEVHFAAFNVDKNFSGVGLGEAMMLEDLDLLAKTKIISAECDPLVPISSNYIERGFVGIGLGQIGEKGILKIVRDNKQVYETKQRSQEEFVKEYLEFELGAGKGLCDKGGYVMIKAPTQPEVDMSYLANGYILSRYFQDGGKEWYAVFEKNQVAKEEQIAA